MLFRSVFAHGGIIDGDEDAKVASLPGSTNSSSLSSTETKPKTEEELKEINNLLGNVVIFVQSTEPTQEQIKKQFDVLEPLSPSTCGG